MMQKRIKRVWCLYRVSTLGQVDHNDIPVQRDACRKYAALHPDWVIQNEVLEKGVSGYKNKAEQREGLIELKKAALEKKFDVLLVFMFDRIGRRTDDTPIVMQWFVNQGIEIWSANEGQRKYDTPEDELVGWLSTWQASGESRKISLRVKASKATMSSRGFYTGGYVPYGYDARRVGRVNKKDQPVRDLVINPDEAEIVQFIFHAVIDLGFGSYVIANALNNRGIPTKRGTSLWRATSIRVLLRNPIYTGRMKTAGGLTEPFEQYRLIDDFAFHTAAARLASRNPLKSTERQGRLRNPEEERGLLTGIIYCGHCGGRITFNHYTQKKKLVNGTIRLYDRDVYRCYTRLYHKDACKGRTSYKASILEAHVMTIMHRFFAMVRKTPKASALKAAMESESSLLTQALQQAKKGLEKIRKDMEKLQEEAIKALTGDSVYSTELINKLLPVQEEKLLEAQQKYDRLKKEREQEKERQAKHCKVVDDLRTWADTFENASFEKKREVIAAAIEKVTVWDENKVDVQLRFTAQQYFNCSEELFESSCAWK